MKKADRKKERFRNEWKYLISTSEKEVLNLRMKPLMKLDPHAETGGYLQDESKYIEGIHRQVSIAFRQIHAIYTIRLHNGSGLLPHAKTFRTEKGI